MKLNKNDIQYILKESVSLLTENTSVSATYRKYFYDMDRNLYDTLINTDPTYNPSKPDVMGKCGLWILNKYKKDDISIYNLSHVNKLLSIFYRYINRIDNKNIQSYKSLKDLYEVVKPFYDNPGMSVSKNQEKKMDKDGGEKTFEDKDWVVIVPHTWEASKKYGAGAAWCTKLADNDKFFKDYSSESPLYIIINKKDNSVKYQFHDSRLYNPEFKDSRNIELIRPCTGYGFTKGLISYFDKVTNNKFSKIYFSSPEYNVGSGWTYFKNGEDSYFSDGERNYHTEDFIPGGVFDAYNYLPVYDEDGLKNFVNKFENDMYPILGKWYEYVNYSECGIFKIRKNGKYYPINKNGRYIVNHGFDKEEGPFYGVTSLVDNDGKCIVFDNEGYVVDDQIFDDYKILNNSDFFALKNNNGWYLYNISSEGYCERVNEDEPYDDIQDVSEEEVKVFKDDECQTIDLFDIMEY